MGNDIIKFITNNISVTIITIAAIMVIQFRVFNDINSQTFLSQEAH